jgi:Tfp pilus assembly protein PilE
MKNNKGISLIVLVITIIVIIILAGAVILSLASNNPIQQASEASFKHTLKEYENELLLWITKEYTLNNGILDTSTINATKNSGTYTKDGNILKLKDIITIIKSEHEDILEIEEGNLKYIGLNESEIVWADEIGVETLTSDNGTDDEILPNVYTNEQITDMIQNEGYIPIASSLELYNIRNSVSDTFGAESEWEGQYTGGPDKKYIQVNDIDMSSYSGGSSWTSFHGSYGPLFSGIYDGNNNKITNLTNNSNETYASLFGIANGPASFKNIIIENANITTTANDSWSSSGILLGLSQGSGLTIENVHVDGTLNCIKGAGGLIGNSSDANIIDCSANVNVSGYVVGGLVGVNMANISNCYANGDVSGVANVGGLVGENHKNIINCYATGTIVSSDGPVGGLVGCIIPGSNLSNSYSIGSVSGVSNVGGLVGVNYGGSLSNCYYNQTTSGQIDTGKGEPRNSVDMIYPYNATTTYIDWDFSNIWDINLSKNEGYPYLR